MGQDGVRRIIEIKSRYKLNTKFFSSFLKISAKLKGDKFFKYISELSATFMYQKEGEREWQVNEDQLQKVFRILLAVQEKHGIHSVNKLISRATGGKLVRGGPYDSLRVKELTPHQARHIKFTPLTFDEFIVQAQKFIPLEIKEILAD